MNIHFCINDKIVRNFILNVNSIHGIGNDVFIIYGNPEIGFYENLVYSNVYYIEQIGDFGKLKMKLAEFERLYIHYLSDSIVILLSKIQVLPTKIIWMFWGSDGFSFPVVVNKFNKFQQSNFKRLYARTIGQLRLSLNDKTLMDRINVMRKITHFAHYIKDDFFILQDHLSNNAEFCYFSYGIKEDFVIEDLDIVDNFVLVGNSADTSNNHLFVLRRFSKFMSNQKLIIPMSYAGNSDYIDLVTLKYSKMFLEKVLIVREKLSFDDYNKIVLSKSKFAIFYHERSQAWGNILQLLWQGTKVLMYEKSTLYIFLKKMGFNVYSSRDMRDDSFFIDLSVEQVDCNRELINENFSKEALMPHIVLLLNI